MIDQRLAAANNRYGAKQEGCEPGSLAMLSRPAPPASERGQATDQSANGRTRPCRLRGVPITEQRQVAVAWKQAQVVAAHAQPPGLVRCAKGRSTSSPRRRRRRVDLGRREYADGSHIVPSADASPPAPLPATARPRAAPSANPNLAHQVAGCGTAATTLRPPHRPAAPPRPAQPPSSASPAASPNRPPTHPAPSPRGWRPSPGRPRAPPCGPSASDRPSSLRSSRPCPAETATPCSTSSCPSGTGQPRVNSARVGVAPDAFAS